MTTTLIPPRKALEILTWVKYGGLHKGCSGTDTLTRYPAGGRSVLYSKEECEALRDKIIAAGQLRSETSIKERPLDRGKPEHPPYRKPITELT